MRVNYNWLSEWVDIKFSPYELADRLDHLGIEVEEVEITSDDAIFELNIMPNRPDLLSVWGLSREIAAKIGRNLKKKIDYSLPDLNQKDALNLTVTIESEEDCPRYIASVIDNIEVGLSPAFISERLTKCGIRTLNNIVDVTNYVLLETGHPLHAFDYDSISGGIIVRRAKNSEIIITLEGEKKELSNEDLVIADNKGPIAIAGVMGGESSGIKDKTTRIVLESAFFKPSLIRRTSRRLKLSTESSYRFERTADIEMLPTASAYTLHLLGKSATKRTARKVIDTNPTPQVKKEVEFSYKNANKLLGKNLKREEVDRIFEKLGFERRETDGSPRILVPSYRRDIKIEEDLTEEIGRFIGYNNIPRRFTYTNEKPINLENKDIIKIKKIMASLGLSEAINIPFIEPFWAEIHKDEPVELKNPMWSDRSILRNTLLPGLIRSVERNLNKGEELVQLFEVGRVFRQGKDEEEMLGAVITGNMPVKWHQEGRPVDFYDIKGIVEAMLEKLNIKDYKFAESEESFYRKERTQCLVIDGTVPGCFGLIAQDSCKADIYGCEFKVKYLLGALKRGSHFSRTSKFPPIKRDLSFIIEGKTPYEKIKNIIQESLTHDVRIELMDEYIARRIGKDKKSLTVRLEFSHPEKTLTDNEIEGDIKTAIDKLKSFGASLRE